MKLTRKNYQSKQLLSIFIIVTVLCFTFLSTLQFCDKIDYAVSLQFNIIENTISFVKTKILYPYLAVFIEVTDFVNNSYPAAENEKKALPVSKSRQRNKIFQQLYFLLSAVLVTNKKILFFLLIVFVGISPGLKKTFDNEFSNSQIMARLKFYVNWIFKFLNPFEKFLKNRDNQYDIAHVKNIVGKITRTLNERFGVRVFFMYKRSKIENLDKKFLREGGCFS